MFVYLATVLFLALSTKCTVVSSSILRTLLDWPGGSAVGDVTNLRPIVRDSSHWARSSKDVFHCGARHWRQSMETYGSVSRRFPVSPSSLPLIPTIKSLIFGSLLLGFFFVLAMLNEIRQMSSRKIPMFVSLFYYYYF
jgi:hypothetical protein